MDTSDAKIKELEKKLLEEEDTVEDVDRAHYILEIGKIYKERKMKKETKAIHTPFQKRDAYGALSFPVYNTVAYEFDSAQVMTEAFAGRVPEPDY